ncbi:MAG: hypothetical protein ACK6D7_04150 [Acidobacteriota bacterium]
MKSLLWLLALGALLPAANVTRPALTAVEDSVNRRLKSLVPGEPYLLLGETHGVYLENYGAVFTASVNLVEGPNVTPFRPAISPRDRAELRQRKLDRLPKLREIMRESLVASAAMLDTVPANEQMVLSVALPRYHWEDTSGLPAQIVMQATRGALVNLQVNPSADPAAAAQTFRIREY